MKKYQDIFFDLDHTLWDYESSARQTLLELYQRYDLSSKVALDENELCESFFKVNYKLWDKYNKGDISKYVLRTQRFRMVFEAIGVELKLFGENEISQFNKDYLYECPQKPNLIDGAIELLDSLSSEYELHIITNGFIEVQATKMEMSGLSPYFPHVITSEGASAKKPQRKIFDFAMKQTGASIASSIMIGDNLSTDIKGARDYGLDQIFFNPDEIPHDNPVTHEVNYLKEIKAILL
ncbi:MAG: putative hydrolase of the HAD superfamily [Cyclobacteriaceae bacterium]